MAARVFGALALTVASTPQAARRKRVESEERGISAVARNMRTQAPHSCCALRASPAHGMASKQ